MIEFSETKHYLLLRNELNCEHCRNPRNRLHYNSLSRRLFPNFHLIKTLGLYEMHRPRAPYAPDSGLKLKRTQVIIISMKAPTRACASQRSGTSIQRACHSKYRLFLVRLPPQIKNTTRTQLCYNIRYITTFFN